MSKGFMCFSFNKKQIREHETSEMNFGLAKVIKYAELKKATNNFATELGQGGFGKVYLGKLGNGKQVAVKALFDRNPKKLEQFFNEVTVLSRLRHKNLVSQYGCTSPSNQELLLVYEYVPNGTVADRIHCQQSVLNWAGRIQIAVETADALAYLHGLEPPVIHRDVKTPNILVDNDFHAKVADLGICRLLPWDATHVSTLPQGTLGYRDPEYDLYLRLTDKTDVYSFGVVLMELITGLQAVDVNRDPEDIYLDKMAINKIINKGLEDFVDPKLGYQSNIDHKRMIDSVAELAGQCLQPKGEMRPPMVQVYTMLMEIQDELQHKGLDEVGVISFVPQEKRGDCSVNDVNLGINNVNIDERWQTQLSEGGIPNSTNLKRYTYDEVSAATRNFRSDSVIGEGGLGPVFKGWIDVNTLRATKPGTGIAIAVKRFNHKGRQGHREWLAEVNFLGRLRHPNLIRLFGYCPEEEETLLIYEFMPRGSLENHLFRRSSLQPLTWNLRMKVMLGAARGLAFLHGPDIEVIYRNFKASEVLLDSNYNGKLSDFGLARNGPTSDNTHVSTVVVGTHGYAAPEYIATGHLTSKCDVYGFGIVLLEVLSGQRVIDRNRPSGQHNLVEWASPYLESKHKLSRILDRRLEGHYSHEAAFKVASLVVQCISSNAKSRPTMDVVVSVLEQLQET